MAGKLLLGHKVRRLRRESGLSQAQMAEQLGISPSYLNLIEHDQRPVSVAVLLQLSQNFGIDLQHFAEDDEARIVGSLSEVLSDAVFQGIDIGKQDLRELAGVSPGFAEALVTLYSAYRQVRQELEAVAAGESEPGAAPGSGKMRHSPVEAAQHFFQSELNHFPELEQASERLWREARLDAASLYSSLARHLESAHGLAVQLMPASIMGAIIRRHDPHRRRILLSEMLPASSRAFQLACQIAVTECRDQIDTVMERFKESDEEARALVRLGLVNYFAGATLLPYQPFAEAAMKVRHDLAVLGARFGVNFEQLCHRLTTLQRPRASGIPFFMIRVDAAGNVSKRFSANSLQFARFGGACPVWNVHHAFQAPTQILTQVAEMPDGNRYLSIARTVATPWRRGTMRAAQYAIGLGCEIRHAEHLVYADGVALDKKAQIDLIGVSCRSCPRGDCAHRAFPAAQQRVPRTDFLRTDPLFASP